MGEGEETMTGDLGGSETMMQVDPEYSVTF
jgi:hypothetical protein